MNSSYLGIEIGGTKLQLVTGTGEGEILRRWRFDVSRSAGAAGIRRQIESALPEIRSVSEVSAIAVGFGGPVDISTGSIACSHQIEGWSGFDIGGWLRGLTGLEVVVENDANVATLGEALRGAGRGKNPVFYVTLGSGVGGGLVLDGRIYHGFKPGESEIGHLRLDRDGTILEHRCSGWAVDRRIRELCAQSKDSLLARMTSGMNGGEARHLAAGLAAGDSLAMQVLDEWAGNLAFGLSHVTHLFHPEVIVLGGGLALAGEMLCERVSVELKKMVMEVFLPGPQICLSGLKEDSVPVGALLLANQIRG